MMYIASLDVNECVFSPDQKYVLTVQKDGALSLWSTVNGEDTYLTSNHFFKEKKPCGTFSTLSGQIGVGFRDQENISSPPRRMDC